MRNMRGHSEGLAWRNFGFLLALTLMPFSSDLIGRFGSNPVAITLFATIQFLIPTAFILLSYAHVGGWQMAPFDAFNDAGLFAIFGLPQAVPTVPAVPAPVPGR